ncbi:hypothetical protein BGZ82_003817, partial [Podila clonocystis]
AWPKGIITTPVSTTRMTPETSLTSDAPPTMDHPSTSTLNDPGVGTTLDTVLVNEIEAIPTAAIPTYK